MPLVLLHSSSHSWVVLESIYRAKTTLSLDLTCLLLLIIHILAATIFLLNAVYEEFLVGTVHSFVLFKVNIHFFIVHLMQLVLLMQVLTVGILELLSLLILIFVFLF